LGITGLGVGFLEILTDFISELTFSKKDTIELTEKEEVITLKDISG